VVAEAVRFYFDPVCPWAWQGSRWIREVAAAGAVDVEWRLFSLKLVNAQGSDPLADVHERGTPALRALALVRREAGNDGVERLYAALGGRVHERGEQLGPDVVRAALDDAGLDPGSVSRALEDASTMEDVRSDFQSVVGEIGCFGVPSIVLESGKGIFGPVIARAPRGVDAVRLWEHVRWLIEAEGFYELKRDRDLKPGS
jgi:2-hydroxychromene-2-carboxylate isomerase